MPIRFIARLNEYDKKHLGFYVPKFVAEFYGLEAGRYKGGFSASHGDLTSCGITLAPFRKTLRGRLAPGVGKKGSVGEVWIYRDTWISAKRPAA